MVINENVTNRKKSGDSWVGKFIGSTSINDLRTPFKESVGMFIERLNDSGATVIIAATLRPPERAYLMHWSWMLSNRRVLSKDIPPMIGVNIDWVHETESLAINAAKNMVRKYGMSSLMVAPALKSRHTEGFAIDMNISWCNNLRIKNNYGAVFLISTEPKNGMNEHLWDVGKTFNVIKYRGGAKDKPHWSIDGR